MQSGKKVRVSISKLVSVGLALVMSLAVFTVVEARAEISAQVLAPQVALPSNHLVSVDGRIVSFRAFNINDSNFFMLRDIAFILSGTQSQFEVTWDGELNAINLIRGTAYTPVGGEMAIGGGTIEVALPGSVAVFVDGVPAALTAFNIGDNNFFMLRDLGNALGFGVDWDEATATILVSSVPTQGAAVAEVPDPPLDTRTQITIPDRRLTAAERAEWIEIYWELGGPAELELGVVQEINRVRLEHGLSYLEIDNNLMMAARFYTQTMVDLGTGLGHNMGPYRVEGATHGASANVVTAFGGRLRWNGGNGASGGGTAESVVSRWMNSDGHRRYILSPEHRYIGVGRSGGFTYLFLSNSR